MKILITGAAGFIGFHVVKSLMLNNVDLIGLDNINDYYDVNLKYSRLEECGIPKESISQGAMVQSRKFDNYRFIQINLENKAEVSALFNAEKFDKVIHLAAQAGVRYSIENPHAYTSSNIEGFLNILEGCRHNEAKHLVFASSSSVYGMNEKMPFSVHDNVDHPISLYAASKKANELMAHTYSYLYGLPVTGLRFFTVYGPWGRPDMALFIFTKAILENKPIHVFNNGKMKRDFTYIDDIVGGILRIVDRIPLPNKKWDGMQPDPGTSRVPYRIYNIGANKSENLMDFIKEIEKNLEKEAKIEFLPMQAGDVPASWADVKDLAEDFNYAPKTTIKQGIKSFIEWYNYYYLHEK